MQENGFAVLRRRIAIPLGIAMVVVGKKTGVRGYVHPRRGVGRSPTSLIICEFL